MLDIKFIRENKDIVKAAAEKKHTDIDLDKLITLDDKRLEILSRVEFLRSEQNKVSNSMGGNVDPTLRSQMIEEMRIVKDELKEKEESLRDTVKEWQSIMLSVPNIPEPTSPLGASEDENIEIRTWGEKTQFSFEPKDHVEIGKIVKAIDTERGAKVAGSRSYYLTGSGALLEFALVNYAISMAVKAGFVPVIPPVLVNPAAMEGTGFLGQAAENVYRIEKDDVYLVGTSEVPLAAMHMDEVLSGDKLPMRYAGYSSCFRREAGTYGKDTRGIIRVHQFDKVEMFSFCHPDQAKEEHARILQWEKDFLDAMEIPYRVIDVASGDLGSSANRKFDCEAWIPTQDAYREVTSTSNCTEFQARRLNIRYKDAEGTKAVATLNGTLVAIPRMIVAILENHQNADGTVNIPKALQPFLGKERFELV